MLSIFRSEESLSYLKTFANVARTNIELKNLQHFVFVPSFFLCCLYKFNSFIDIVVVISLKPFITLMIY